MPSSTPCVLVGAGLLAVFIIFLGVIPKFAPLLRAAAVVPEFSVWVIETAVFFKANVLFISLGLAAVVGLVVYALLQPEVRRRLMDRLSRAPVLGAWLRDAEVGRWASLTGAMLRNRVPLLEALRLSRGATALSEFEVLLSSAVRALEGGRSLHDALSHSPWIAPARLNLIKVGERAGNLDAMLSSLGKLQPTRPASVRRPRWP